MNGFPAVPDAQHVQQLLQVGEGQTVEFEEVVPSVLRLAQLLSAFANAQGGVILVGVRENPRSVIGCNYPLLAQVFDRATANLDHANGITLHQVTVNDRHVGWIRVHQYQPLMATRAGAFIREGTNIRAMTADEIAARLAPPPAMQAEAPPQLNINILAQAIATNTETITGLQADLRYSQSIRGQWKAIVISFIIGCITGVIGNYIFKALGN